MILVDANLLVYAQVASLPRHEAAKQWLDGQLSGRVRVGLPWQSLLAFTRLTVNPRIFEHPQPVDHAWAQVSDWLDAPSAWVPTPTERHREVLATLIGQVTTANLVPDAHLAALAVEHGLVLASTDTGFARFKGLRWDNPLEAG